ncbi:spike base protein, RCAP_Rcc01079 family [Ancylobacter vacuolatus]|uniref:Uncharacterized protein n=1 Tax=Ancylobacter vacuolatus TaxID=223389 RepID=A0ABU0DMP9_9HYPH|nr:hypothetical protein [Ancylobacter vacuolatus]MDQ0349731.1 hypothetical protein [Ancylobacter vacuolatus]
MADTFANFSTGLTAPADDAFAITPADGADLAILPRALWIGGAGTVKVTMKGGGEVTFTHPGGAPLDIRARRVWSTGTTATGIIGLV